MKIIFFFKSDRKARVGVPGYPEDLLYGYSQIGEQHEVEILEQNDFSEWKPEGIADKLKCWFSEKFLAIKYDHIRRYSKAENLKLLNRGDVIVVTTVTQGITLAILKYGGKLQGELIFCATAVANHTKNPIFWWLMRRVCRNSYMASLSKGEIKALQERLGLPVSFYVFGTQHTFWTAGQDESEMDPYVLAVGNDAKRDYHLLVKSWKPEYPRLKIVTASVLPDPLPENVERVTSNWHMGDSVQTETEAERLRGLYRRASFVVTPLQETFQPSGQSVSLQTMACGKALIVSDIKGIWDREVMRHGENCLLCPLGDVKALQQQIERLLSDQALCMQLGRQARSTVEAHYTLNHTAESVFEIVKKMKPNEAGKVV